MNKDGKLRLSPLQKRAVSEPEQTQPQQGGRYMAEVNGLPVWLSSSRTSETQRSQEPSDSEETKRIASNIKRRFGISDE